MAKKKTTLKKRTKKKLTPAQVRARRKTKIGRPSKKTSRAMKALRDADKNRAKRLERDRAKRAIRKALDMLDQVKVGRPSKTVASPNLNRRWKQFR